MKTHEDFLDLAHDLFGDRPWHSIFGSEPADAPIVMPIIEASAQAAISGVDERAWRMLATGLYPVLVTVLDYRFEDHMSAIEFREFIEQSQISGKGRHCFRFLSSVAAIETLKQSVTDRLRERAERNITEGIVCYHGNTDTFLPVCSGDRFVTITLGRNPIPAPKYMSGCARA